MITIEECLLEECLLVFRHLFLRQ